MVLVLTVPGGGDPTTGDEGRPRGSLGSCYYISQEVGPGKVGEGGKELFVCSWNARRGTVECRGPGRGDARHVLRKHRDFVLTVGTVGEMKRDRHRSNETHKEGGREKGRYIKRSETRMEEPRRARKPT